MSNELVLSTSSTLSSPVVVFQDSSYVAIYPDSDTFQDDYQISHLPTLDGKGVLQKKTNDYRLFTVSFPALTNSDFDTMLTGLKSCLYTTSGIEYFFGTTNGFNYALPYTNTTGTTYTIKVRLINIEKVRIPNSYKQKIFNLILTFQRVN